MPRLCALTGSLTAIVGTAFVAAATLAVPRDHATIQAAVDAAVDGDTIEVAPGVYGGPGNVAVSVRHKTIAIRAAAGPGTVTIDCEGSPAFSFCAPFTESESVLAGFVIRGAGGGAAVDVFAQLAIEDCTIEGGDFACIDVRSLGAPGTLTSTLRMARTSVRGSRRTGIRSERASVLLSRCEIRDHRCAGLWGGEATFHVEDSRIVENGMEGVVGIWCTIRLSRTVVARNGSDGVRVHGLHVVDIAGSLLAANDGDGYHVLCDVDGCVNIFARTTIRGSTIADHRGAGISIVPPPRLDRFESAISGTIISANQDGAISAGDMPLPLAISYSAIDAELPWPGDGNIAGDPLFAGAAPRNGEIDEYRLDEGSPCIDAGSSADTVGSDLSGNPRRCGRRADIGALERCDSTTQSFRRGEVNGDGRHDISDAVALLEYLFRGTAEVACRDAADVDDSGTLGLADAIALLDFLFRSGRPPHPPFDECGPDASDDTLDCVALGACA